MQREMHLKTAFAKNIFRRLFFWSLGVHAISTLVVGVLTISYSGGIVTILGSLKYVVALTTILQIVTLSFLHRWEIYAGFATLNTVIHAILTGPLVGAATYYVIVERFSLIHGEDNRRPNCEVSSLIFYSIFTIFAFLVDNGRSGSFRIVLPDSCPIIFQRLQKVILSDLSHWFRTALFIGVALVCIQKVLSFLGLADVLIFSSTLSCKPNDLRTGCQLDQWGNGNILLSLYFSSLVSFIIRIVLEIAHSLLILMITYPLDFSKLEVQATSSVCKGASEEGEFISNAIAIDGAQLDKERFSWNRHIQENKERSSRAVSGFQPLSVRVENDVKRSLLLESSSLSRVVVPAWQEAVERQRDFAEKLIADIKPNFYGPPILPFFSSNTAASRFDIICRSLALQDMKRSTLTSFPAKKKLFETNGKWPEIVFSCCGILDAATLQLQLHVAYAVCEILEPKRASVASQALQTATLTSRASHQSLGQGVSLVGIQATGDSVATEWNGSTPWAATGIIKEGKDLREKTLLGRASKTINGNIVLLRLIPHSVVRAITGITEMEFDPLPPLIVQSVIHSLECVSVLLVSALSLDPTGTAQHHLVSVLHSLLALELALKGHSDTLNRCLSHSSSSSTPKGIATAALLNSSSRVHHKHMSPLGLTRSGTLLSAGLAAIEIAVDDAITRLIKGYKDVLVTHVFPQLYSDSLKVKISALS